LEDFAVLLAVGGQVADTSALGLPAASGIASIRPE